MRNYNNDRDDDRNYNSRRGYDNDYNDYNSNTGSHSYNHSGSGSGRGFASMDEDRQREIASMGGKASHRSGNAHEWDSREAAEAGHLGGMVE